jgi:hypothetical protein
MVDAVDLEVPTYFFMARTDWRYDVRHGHRINESALQQTQETDQDLRLKAPIWMTTGRTRSQKPIVTTCSIMAISQNNKWPHVWFFACF